MKECQSLHEIWTHFTSVPVARRPQNRSGNRRLEDVIWLWIFNTSYFHTRSLSITSNFSIFSTRKLLCQPTIGVQSMGCIKIRKIRSRRQRVLFDIAAHNLSTLSFEVRWITFADTVFVVIGINVFRLLMERSHEIDLQIIWFWLSMLILCPSETMFIAITL